MRSQARFARLQSLALIFSTLAALFIQTIPVAVSAATLLGSRSVTIASSAAGVVTTHQFALTMLNTATPVGSMTLEFCSNTPVPNTPCTFPTGFSASAAVLAAQTGDNGFIIDIGSSTANKLVLARPPSNPLGTASTYRFDNITNPSASGSYYVRLQTFSSIDGTGIDIENGGVVFAVTSGLSVNAEVPPYLKFCVGVTIASFDCSTASGSFIDFGELRPTATSKASSQFLVGTNADSGYSVFISGTTLTSGTNTIPALASPTASSIGASQFGLNLKANSAPLVGAEVVGPGSSTANGGYASANQYKFVAGDSIVTVANGDDSRKFTVSYITNISSGQVAGIYATTITYICLANF